VLFRAIRGQTASCRLARVCLGSVLANSTISPQVTLGIVWPLGFGLCDLRNVTTSNDPLSQLESRLGYTFRDRNRLLEALTHASYLQDDPLAGPNNQRLEFLGDTVLQFILTDALYAEFPNEREGILSRKRAILTKGKFLTQMARSLQLEAYIRLNKSEEEAGGRERASILEDCFEALLGAIYLDSDLPTIQRLVLAWYGPLTAHLVDTEAKENPKGLLQEIVQPDHGNSALLYKVTDTTGPKHARVYEATVFLIDEIIGIGTGSSKKAAEESAARIALDALRARKQAETK
jgi:ribonuclease III